MRLRSAAGNPAMQGATLMYVDLEEGGYWMRGEEENTYRDSTS